MLNVSILSEQRCSDNVCLVFLEAIADDAVRYQYVKKKGYVRLHTNKGDLNVELHCDKVTQCESLKPIFIQDFFFFAVWESLNRDYLTKI